MILPNHAICPDSESGCQRTRPSRRGCNPRVPRAGSLSLGRRAQMRMPLLILAVALALLNGCRTPPVIESSSAIPTGANKWKPLEAPKDGKILVLISGNAKEQGRVWVQEGVSLATIEDLFACRPEWASRSLVIERCGAESVKTIRCRLSSMSRSEKEKIKVYHGDSICFVYDRCFGFVPDHALKRL